MARRYRIEKAGKEKVTELVRSLSPYQEEALDAIENGNAERFNAILESAGRFGDQEKNALRNSFNEVVS